MFRVRSAVLSVLMLLVFAGAERAVAQENTRIRDVVYGRKFGMALTMDVVRPAEQNGGGVIFVVSGGFQSGIKMVDSEFFGPVIMKPFLDRGYTLFLVSHGAEPKFTVSEIVAEMQRAVRFIRHHAQEYGVDGDRLGIMGASSGGYLSLAMGTFGEPGDPAAADPVERTSSRVQAVACFCPPCDFVDYGKRGRSVVEYEPVSFVWHALGVEGLPKDEQTKRLRELSPLAAISRETAPTLIIHGDADRLVPFEQSERFTAQLDEHDVPHQLIRREKAGHGWPEQGQDFKLLADWFDKYLRAKADKSDGS